LDPKNFLPKFNQKTLLIGAGIGLVALLAFKKR
jgi:hypothetical protein